MIESDLDSDVGPPSQGSEMEVLSPHLIDTFDALSKAPPPPPPSGGGVRWGVLVGFGVVVLGIVVTVVALAGAVLLFLVVG